MGLVRFHLEPGRIALLHTETDPEVRGRGVASRLIRFALESARDRQLEVLPYCPFVRSYIEGHDEYLDLVPQDVRPRFGLPES